MINSSNVCLESTIFQKLYLDLIDAELKDMP